MEPKSSERADRRPHHREAGREVLVELQRIDELRVVVDVVRHDADVEMLSRTPAAGRWSRDPSRWTLGSARSRPNRLLVRAHAAHRPHEHEGPLRMPAGQGDQEGDVEELLDDAHVADARAAVSPRRSSGSATRQAQDPVVDAVRHHLGVRGEWDFFSQRPGEWMITLSALRSSSASRSADGLFHRREAVLIVDVVERGGVRVHVQRVVVLGPPQIEHDRAGAAVRSNRRTAARRRRARVTRPTMGGR